MGISVLCFLTLFLPVSVKELNSNGPRKIVISHQGLEFKITEELQDSSCHNRIILAGFLGFLAQCVANTDINEHVCYIRVWMVDVFFASGGLWALSARADKSHAQTSCPVPQHSHHVFPAWLQSLLRYLDYDKNEGKTSFIVINLPNPITNPPAGHPSGPR